MAVTRLTSRQTTAYISGQAAKDTRTVSQYVTGEATASDFGFSSEPQPAAAESAETSMAEESHLAEDLTKGEAGPLPTVEQRRYSVDWDPAQ